MTQNMQQYCNPQMFLSRNLYYSCNNNHCQVPAVAQPGFKGAAPPSLPNLLTIIPGIMEIGLIPDIIVSGPLFEVVNLYEWLEPSILFDQSQCDVGGDASSTLASILAS